MHVESQPLTPPLQSSVRRARLPEVTGGGDDDDGGGGGGSGAVRVKLLAVTQRGLAGVSEAHLYVGDGGGSTHHPSPHLPYGHRVKLNRPIDYTCTHQMYSLYISNNVMRRGPHTYSENQE